MKLFWLKAKTAFLSVSRVIFIPVYSLMATGIALLVLWLMLILYNLGALGKVISSPRLDIGEKLAFMSGIFGGLATNFDAGQAISLVVFAVLSGINLALLVYILRHGHASAAAGGTNFLAALAALIGSGCAVCGGSILTPLLGVAGATFSVAAVRTIGTAANIIGILLLVFSIYGLGKAVAQIDARIRLA